MNSADIFTLLPAEDHVPPGVGKEQEAIARFVARRWAFSSRVAQGGLGVPGAFEAVA